MFVYFVRTGDFMEKKRIIKSAVYTLMAICGIFILKYFFSLFAPFIFAMITAAFIEPISEKCSLKLHIGKKLSSIICCTVILAIICSTVSFVAIRTVYELSSFVRELPKILSSVTPLIITIEKSISRFISNAPGEIQEYMIGAMDNILEEVAQLPGVFTGKSLSFLSSVLSRGPGLILFVVSYILGVFFISMEYTQIKNFLITQMPFDFRKKAADIKKVLMLVCGKWIKTQMILTGITFVQLIFLFIFMRIEYAALLAFIIAVIDALPVFGAGVILIPWSFIKLLGGDSRSAVVLIIAYCTIYIVKSLLEPKLISGQLGISPAVTLAALYVGYRCFGVIGMVVFPIILVVLKQFNEKGYIKLWRKTTKEHLE